MLLSFCEFCKIGAGKAVFFLGAQIKSHLRLHHETVWYFESKERSGKVTVLCHGVHNLQSCLLIMKDTMIHANQIKSMKMDEKMCTGQNRISLKIQIKCTFKLPARKENSRCCTVATGWIIVIWFPAEAQTFAFHTTSWIAMRPTWFTTQRVPGAFPPCKTTEK